MYPVSQQNEDFSNIILCSDISPIQEVLVQWQDDPVHAEEGDLVCGQQGQVSVRGSRHRGPGHHRHVLEGVCPGK